MKQIIIAAVLAITAFMISSCAAVDTAKEKISSAINEITTTDATETPAVYEQAPTEVSNNISVGIMDADTWNPLLTNSHTVHEMLELIYEPLFELNQNYEAVPVLASDYNVSPDGRIFEINIKDGVLWHDGSAVDAYDAAYTVKQILSGTTNYTNMLSDVADYRAINSKTIRFVLKSSIPDFTALLTFPIIKYQTNMNAGLSAAPIGTGPYSFYGKISTDRYMLTAFDGYHNGRALIDAVYVITVPELRKYQLMFEASEIDVITDNSVNLMEGMIKGSVNVNDYVSNRMTYLGFNTASEVIGGAATRRGIAQLLDKDEITREILYSRAVPADTAINPSSYLYYDISERLTTEYETAYEEFEKDGWASDGYGFERKINGQNRTLKVSLLVNSDDKVKVEVAEHIKEVMGRYGVEVILDRQNAQDYTNKLVYHDFDMFIGEETIRENNDLTSMTCGGNIFSYSNEAVNTLIAQAGLNDNAEYRKQIFIQIGETLKEDMPFTPIYFMKESVISGSKIKNGIAPSMSADYRVSNIWQVK